MERLIPQALHARSFGLLVADLSRDSHHRVNGAY
jgi:hypothetical protein